MDKSENDNLDIDESRIAKTAIPIPPHDDSLKMEVSSPSGLAQVPLSTASTASIDASSSSLPSHSQDSEKVSNVQPIASLQTHYSIKQISESDQQPPPDSPDIPLALLLALNHVPSPPSPIAFQKNSGNARSLCPCKKIFDDSELEFGCQICGETLTPYMHRARETIEVRMLLETIQNHLEQEQNKSLRLLTENQVRLLRIQELEDVINDQHEETKSLKSNLNEMSEQFQKTNLDKEEMVVERDRISGELEELTRSLFEQANGMVADEARRRFALEQSQKVLQTELVKAKDKLVSERMEVLQLRRKLSQVSLKSLRSSSHVSTSETFAHLSITDDTVDMRISAIPTNDSFASLDVDLLHDRRLYDDFLFFYNKCGALSYPRLLTGIPLIKWCLEEHTEPCLKLVKLSSRKLLDAITNNLVRIRRVDSTFTKAATSTASEGVDDVPSSETNNSSTTATVESPQPRKTGSNHHQSHSMGNFPFSTTPDPPSTRTPSTTNRSTSPSKQALWGGLSALTTSSAPISSPELCGACGRESQCLFLLTLNINTKADVEPAWIYIDTWCRDRIYAVWEFFSFIRKVREFAVRQTDVELATRSAGAPISAIAPVPLKDLFLEFLRILKQMFYARLGVMSYFRIVQDELIFLVEQNQQSFTTASKTASTPNLADRQ